MQTLPVERDEVGPKIDFPGLTYAPIIRKPSLRVGSNPGALPWLSWLVTVRVPRAETTADGEFTLTLINALIPETSSFGVRRR